MGSIIKPVPVPDNQIVYPASVICGRGIALDSMNTAASSDVQRRPLSYSDANVHPVYIANATRMFCRAKYPIATTTITTSPVVLFFGVVCEDESLINGNGTFPDTDDCGVIFLNSATITMNAGTDRRDTDFYYSALVFDETPLDMKGCRWLLPIVSTAAVITDGSDPTVPQLEVFLLN